MESLAARPDFARIEAAALVSLILILAGATLDTAPLGAAKVLLGCGALLALAVAYLALKSGLDCGHGGSPAKSDGLARQLEQVKDAHWQLTDNEARYLDLLDTQDDMIVRRDGAAKVVFANKAFCRQFAVALSEINGKAFAPEVLEGDIGPGLTPDGDQRRRRVTEFIQTQSGPRWIAWDEQLVAAPGAGFEVQSTGRDVTVQREAEAVLKDARDQAQAANRAKSRFLAAMSHEIRTPMNGILGMAGLLLETQQTAEQKTYTGAIDQSARALHALIDEILDFSKIEAGKLELARAPFSLRQCIQGATELLAPRACEKGLDLAWRFDPEIPQTVLGDEARVRQIVLNLLSNAVKFTDRGGVSITVAPAMPLGTVAITVKDTGIGLSLADMSRLFDEFEQADAAIQRREGGTGLGLAISRRLAKAMGGDILVDGKPGAGATFTAVLKLDPGLSPDFRDDGDAGAAPAAHAGLGVLLAFDRTLERNAMASVLESAGIPVCQSGVHEALTVAERAIQAGQSFSHLITDAETGPEVCGALMVRIAARQPGRPVRGIILVSVLSRQGAGTFRAHGFDGCLVRPVRPESLLGQITGGIERDAQPASDSLLAAEPGKLAAQPGRKRRVLVAEDNEINALLARRVLEKAGCDAVVVRNGRAAVAAMRATLGPDAAGFDLVLMDVFMPELDGLAATREIRGLFSGPEGQRPGLPPIIALTANAFPEDRARCLAAGMSDYLAKPFDAGHLKDVLNRWAGDGSAQTPEGLKSLKS